MRPRYLCTIKVVVGFLRDERDEMRPASKGFGLPLTVESNLCVKRAESSQRGILLTLSSPERNVSGTRSQELCVLVILLGVTVFGGGGGGFDKATTPLQKYMVVSSIAEVHGSVHGCFLKTRRGPSA